MTKYLIMYNSTMSAEETIKNASSDQMKASMAEWIAWKDTASKTMNVEFGMPLQSVGKVTPGGVIKSDSQVGGYAMIESESKETLLEQLQSHPQLRRQGASIDVYEMISMPGL
jgi:hypothetical protein